MTTETAVQTYSIDKAHSEATFQVRHLITKVRGRFTDFAGTPTIHSGTAFATNGRLHAAALEMFRSGVSAGS